VQGSQLHVTESRAALVVDREMRHCHAHIAARIASLRNVLVIELGAQVEIRAVALEEACCEARV
jgi:hypothetical protein